MNIGEKEAVTIIWKFNASAEVSVSVAEYINSHFTKLSQESKSLLGPIKLRFAN